MQGFTPEAIDALVQRPECDVILIEADGSRGMPLKAPDEHETLHTQKQLLRDCCDGRTYFGRESEHRKCPSLVAVC
ncbi:selenium-dependent hydroxylase accessory protein YqeC [Escherichia coli]|uniref:Selenium-dependent hydroxylase accessory protein YqeC n=1 Tax=Escherichia coli TaxID=562 RepID=A0A2X3JBX3_ECOLX|nr:selenium-dependent hydroxylase accessory protein YqeC [Escherichia coli]